MDISLSVYESIVDIRKCIFVRESVANSDCGKVFCEFFVHNFCTMHSLSQLVQILTVSPECTGRSTYLSFSGVGQGKESHILPETQSRAALCHSFL